MVNTGGGKMYHHGRKSDEKRSALYHYITPKYPRSESYLNNLNIISFPLIDKNITTVNHDSHNHGFSEHFPKIFTRI